MTSDWLIPNLGTVSSERKQSHTLKVPCYQKKRKNNGSIGNSKINIAHKVLDSTKNSLTKLYQRITKMAEEDFLDKILFLLSIFDHLIAIIKCVALEFNFQSRSRMFGKNATANFVSRMVLKKSRFH